MYHEIRLKGFTLVELMVVMGIIGLLSTILFASFDESRAQARDKARLVALKEMQLAIEQYRAQKGSYPLSNNACGGNNALFYGPGKIGTPDNAPGLSACTTNPTRPFYILGLVPDYISKLPFDSQFELERNRGFYYRSDGASYKLMAYDVVETLLVDNFNHEFARCPSAGGGCGADVPATTYAVYSPGAEDW